MITKPSCLVYLFCFLQVSWGTGDKENWLKDMSVSRFAHSTLSLPFESSVIFSTLVVKKLKMGVSPMLDLLYGLNPVHLLWGNMFIIS